MLGRAASCRPLPVDLVGCCCHTKSPIPGPESAGWHSERWNIWNLKSRNLGTNSWNKFWLLYIPHGKIFCAIKSSVKSYFTQCHKDQMINVLAMQLLSFDFRYSLTCTWRHIIFTQLITGCNIILMPYKCRLASQTDIYTHQKKKNCKTSSKLFSPFCYFITLSVTKKKKKSST